MRYEIIKPNKITNSTEWFCFAPPKGGGTQWKVGRSAMEMARFAMSNAFEEMICNLLTDLELNTEQTFICEPEAETFFPADKMGTGGPRNHDLLMIGENCVIGIEAKVSESFDKTLKEKYQGASANMKKRLKGAIRYIYGDNPPLNVNDLKYQLFSATIGTIEEVKKARMQNEAYKDTEARNALLKNAIVLFVVFTGEIDQGEVKKYDKAILTNNEDYEAFCTTFGISSPGGKIDVCDAEGINCYIKKIEVDISQSSYIIK